MSFIQGLKSMFSQNDTNVSEHWNVLEKVSEADEVFDKSKQRPQLLYKHSSRCGTCMFTKSELDKNSDDIKEQADMHFVDVIGSRNVSDYIAEKLNLRHESPQAILLVDGKIEWHGSHSSIKSSKILEALYGN